MSPTKEELFEQFGRMMAESSDIPGRLREREGKRERNGAYLRYQQYLLHVAKRLDRETLERGFARLGTELRLHQNWQTIRSAERDSMMMQSHFHNAHVRPLVEEQDARREAKYRELITRPATDGAKARDVRWKHRDKTRAYVLERWRERAWSNKSVFARAVLRDVIAFGKANGYHLTPSNAERTIKEWLKPDKS